jgi:tripartite-type tricarboxylate transporter receptor subunit TctC
MKYLSKNAKEMKETTMKKNYLKRIASLGMATVLTMALAACGQTSSSTTSTSSETSAAGADTASASTDTFPEDSITIVVPFSAGSGTDVGARNIQQLLAKELGVNILIENVTGSGGWIGWTDVIKNSEADGYTIGMINHNFVMGAYDDVTPRDITLDDVELLTNQVIDYNVLAIRSDETRFTDLESFITYAQNNEVMVSAQSTGITDGDATTAEWFNKNYNTKISIVPVDGASDGRSMFLAGDTDVYFASVGDVYVQHNNGDMKVVCVFAPERSSFLPDVPTMQEINGGNLVAFACRGFFYRKGVDQAIVEKVRAALLKCMEDAEYQEKMTSMGLQVDTTNGDAYIELLNSQLEMRKEVWGIE